MERRGRDKEGGRGKHFLPRCCIKYPRLLRCKACLLCWLLAAHVLVSTRLPGAILSQQPRLCLRNRKWSCSWRDKAHSWARRFVSELGWGGRPGSGVGSDWEVTRGSVLEEVHAVLRLRAGRKGRLDPGGSRGAQRRKQ